MLFTKPKCRRGEELKQEAELMMKDVDVLRQAFKIAPEKATTVLSRVALSDLCPESHATINLIDLFVRKTVSLYTQDDGGVR